MKTIRTIMGLGFVIACVGCGDGGGGSSGNDNGGGSDKCLPGQGCAIFPDLNPADGGTDARLDNYQPPDLGPQGEVLEALLEPYRWVEGDWTCTEGNPILVGKTETVTLIGWAGEDKGAKVSGFFPDYNYVLKQADGTFTYVGLDYKKEVATKNGIFKFDGDITTLDFDLDEDTHFKFQKE